MNDGVVPQVQVMGIVNVTDDSFSDGGRYCDTSRAIEHGCLLAAQGATIIDVGGESTRPGAVSIDPVLETQRIVPVVKGLVEQGITVSIDTMHAVVARAALDHGASIVNDVSGGRGDCTMAAVVAEAKALWVLMHWPGVKAQHPHQIPSYNNAVTEVRDELLGMVDAAVLAGVAAGNLIIDPGIGFGKAAQHNWALLRALPEFVATGIPVLVGASRKRFLGELLRDTDEVARPVGEREVATAVISALSSVNGVWGVRVHDVRASIDAIKVAQAWTSWTDPMGERDG